MADVNPCEVRDVLCQFCSNNDEDQFDCNDVHSGDVQCIRCNRCTKDFCLPWGSWEALLAAHRAERGKDLTSDVDQYATASLECDVHDVQTRVSRLGLQDEAAKDADWTGHPDQGNDTPSMAPSPQPEGTVPEEATGPDLWGMLLMIPCKCGNRERFELITEPDGSLVARQCAECSDCTGVDATTAVEDILSLLEQGSLKTKPCAGCGNDDVNLFIFHQDSPEGDIVLRCARCHVISPLMMPDDDAFLNDIQRDGVGDKPGDDCDPGDTISPGSLSRQCPECGEDVTDVHYEDTTESKQGLIRCGHCDCQLPRESIDAMCECGNADMARFSVHVDKAKQPMALECSMCSHVIILNDPQVQLDVSKDTDYPHGMGASGVCPDEVSGMPNVLQEHGAEMFIKLKQVSRPIAEKAVSGIVASGGRLLSGGGKMATAGLVAAACLPEAVNTASDIFDSYGHMKDGRISQKDFTKSAIRGGCRGGVTIGGMVAGTLVGAFIPVVGPVVGSYVGSAIGKFVGNVFGDHAQDLVK